MTLQEQLNKSLTLLRANGLNDAADYLQKQLQGKTLPYLFAHYKQEQAMAGNKSRPTQYQGAG